MRFGFVLPHFRHVGSANAIRDSAQMAESLGFDSVWVTDRAALPPGEETYRYGPVFFDPLVTLSYVAARTTRVRLGASVFVIPFRSPVLMARALASLDQLSNGRLDVGVGTGWMAKEFATVGARFTRRGAITDEYVDAMLALWSSPVASFAGPTVRFDDLATEPLPLQRPHPPIYVGGSSAAAVRRTVRIGAAWHGGPAPLGSHLPVIAALREEGERQGRTTNLRLTTRAVLKFRPTKTEQHTADAVEPVGTPDEIIATLQRYAEAGFSEVVLDTFFFHPELNSATPETVMTTLATFAAEVMPAFARV